MGTGGEGVEVLRTPMSTTNKDAQPVALKTSLIMKPLRIRAVLGNCLRHKEIEVIDAEVLSMC